MRDASVSDMAITIEKSGSDRLDCYAVSNVGVSDINEAYADRCDIWVSQMCVLYIYIYI